MISVIGDGALTGGMAYEALNNAAQIRKNFIIVLNDNEIARVRLITSIANGIRIPTQIMTSICLLPVY